MGTHAHPSNSVELHTSLPPQSTTFVGRVPEVAEIGELLLADDCRLLTLVGSGGIGKTRLALEVAAERAQSFDHGIAFVALQPLRVADDVVRAMASALGFKFARAERSSIGLGDQTLDPHQQLLNYLREKQLLLIMDNFEHILDASSIVAEVIQAAPRVKVLATSREALNMRQEWVRLVEGMRFPEDSTAEYPEQYSAVQLFADRARQVRAGFDLDQEYPCVAEITRLVEGMPLALELAATWLRALSCQELVTEIGRNVDILKTSMRDIPERHRSIRAVFDCSWGMIAPEEQEVFMQLSVFRGGATRQGVQAVTGASLAVLSSLVDKSLLQTTRDGRYRIHPLLRQYTREQLAKAGQLEATRNAHCQYFAAFMEEREQGIKDHRQLTTLDEIDADFENVHAAWEWATLCRNGDAIERMVECLCLFLWMRSRWRDAKEPFQKAHEAFAPQPGEEPSSTWGMLLARYPYDKNNRDQELAIALRVAKKRNDLEEIALALYMTGTSMMMKSERKHAPATADLLARADALFDESMDIYQTIGDDFHVGELLIHKAWVYSDVNDVEDMMECTLQSLEIHRRIGNKQGEGYGLSNLGAYKFQIMHFDESERLSLEGLALAREVGNQYAVATTLTQLGGSLAFGVRGDLPEARRLVDEGFAIAVDFNAYYGKTWALIFRSLFASMDEDYDQARELGEIARTYCEERGYLLPVNWALSVAFCGLGVYDHARAEVQRALSAANAIQRRVWATVAIPVAAVLHAQDGNLLRATELLALSLTCDRIITGWVKCWSLCERVHRDLQDNLESDEFQVAWQRGSQLDLDTILQELIVEFQDWPVEEETGPPTAVLAANQTLVEPLSDRELEVLALIAEGHSNREIAEQLFIGVSTVKKHITHIYGKLDVDSRTRALVRAGDLGLV